METFNSLLETLDVWKNVGKNPALVLLATITLSLFYIFSWATGKKIRIEKAEQKKTEQKTESISTQEEIAEDAYTSILNKVK